MKASKRTSTIAAQYPEVRVEPASAQSTLVPVATMIYLTIGRRTDNRAYIVDYSRRMNDR